MFGKKKEPKKNVYKKLVMLANGLSNFINDSGINIIVDEINECITFEESKRKGFECATATLPFYKIKNLEMGEKGSIQADKSTTGAVIGGIVGGSTGAIIGSTTGKAAANIPTLKIRYVSNDEDKEINLYQCNYYSEGSIQFVKVMIDKNIQAESSEQHINL